MIIQMLGWISILIGITLIVLNAKSVWDRTAPLRSSAYNKALTSLGYTPSADTSTISPTDKSTPDPNTVGSQSVSTKGSVPNDPSSISGDKTNTGYQAAISEFTDTPPAPTPGNTDSGKQPANTSKVGSSSSIWPIEFFITTDVLGLVIGLLLIYLGYHIEFPYRVLLGGGKRRRV